MNIFILPLTLCRGTRDLYNYVSNGAGLVSQSQQSSINQGRDLTVTIPNEIIKEIFSYLNPTDLGHSGCVSQKWTLLASDPIKMAIYKYIVVGPEKYAEYLDPEALKVEYQKAYASLPKNTLEDRKMKSGAFPGETIGETEILFWSVGSCTVNICGEIFKKYLPDANDHGFAYKSDPIGDEYDKPSGESQWVSLTIKLLPNSLKKPYKGEGGFFGTEGQVEMVAKLAKETGLNYEVPIQNLFIQGILAHLITTRQKGIDTEGLEYLFKEVYSRLQERGHYGQRVVGCSGPAGSFISHFYDDGYSDVGVAALRKFPVLGT